MRILLADEHVMLRDGLKPHLKDLATQVTVFEAGSFPEAFAVIDREQPLDLALLHLSLPGMNWAAALGALRQRWPAQKVAVLSSVSDRRLVLDALNLGIVGFIPKHLGAAALVSALQLILAGEKFVPAVLIPGVPANDPGRPPAADSPLTRRERDVLRLVRDGLPNKAIARALRVSEITVKSHVCHIFRKLGVQNRVQAARLAFHAEEF